MKYELTAEQTKQIAGYSYSTGVVYYDVELEIVDHVAAWVENDLNTTEASFDEAFEKMKLAFPQSELLKIVQQKKKHIERRFSRMIEKEFLSFFTLPKLSLTVMLLVMAVTFPYLRNSLQIITGCLLGCLFIYYSIFIGAPMQKEIKAISDMKRCELLSVKVRSRYEWMLHVFFIVANSINVIRLFFVPENSLHFSIQDPVTKAIALQSVLVFSVLISILHASAMTVRLNILNKIVNDYPYAFTE